MFFHNSLCLEPKMVETAEVEYYENVNWKWVSSKCLAEFKNCSYNAPIKPKIHQLVLWYKSYNGFSAHQGNLFTLQLIFVENFCLFSLLSPVNLFSVGTVLCNNTELCRYMTCMASDASICLVSEFWCSNIN
jgi:hypothetical protein